MERSCNDNVPISIYLSQRDLIKHQGAHDIILADGYRDRKMISYNRATFNEKPGIKKKSLIPLVFFIVALIINLIGVKYGFPVLTHNDEPAIIDPVIEMTNNRTLKNSNSNRPDQVTIQFYFGYLNLVSKIHYGQNMAKVFDQDPTFIYLHARIIIAILGAFIPVVAWKIGNRIKGKTLGIFFALLCVFYPSYIFNSRFITPDIPITLFTFLAIYFAIKFISEEKLKFLGYSAFLSAMSTCEKYSGLLTAGVVIIALILRYHLDKDTSYAIRIKIFVIDSLKMLGIFFLGILIFGYNLYTDIPRVIEGFRYEIMPGSLGADGLSYTGNLLFYVREFIKQTNPLILAMISVGIFAICQNKEKRFSLFLVSLVYWLSLSVFAIHFERWSLPMMILPLFVAAYGFDHIASLVEGYRVSKMLFVAISVIGLGYFIVSGSAEAVRWAWPDTRGIALSYLNNEGIKEEESVYEGYSPFHPQKWKNFHDIDRETILDGKKYIIMSDHMHSPFFNEPERYEDVIEYYDFLRSSSTLIKTFVPDREYKTFPQRVNKIWAYTKWALGGFGETDITTGPIIEIYEINK